MAAIDHRDAGKIRGAKPVLQGERVRWRQCRDIAIGPKRNEVLVGFDHAFGNDPRICRLACANEAQRNVGCAGQGLQQGDGSRQIEGWEMKQRLAGAVKLRSLNTAAKYRSSRISIVLSYR